MAAAVLLSWRTVCLHHTTMHQFIVLFILSLICRVHSCLAVTCHLRFWQNDRNRVRATAVSRGLNGYRYKSAESGPCRRKFSRRSSWDLNPRPSDHASVDLPLSYLRSLGILKTSTQFHHQSEFVLGDSQVTGLYVW